MLGSPLLSSSLLPSLFHLCWCFNLHSDSAPTFSLTLIDFQILLKFPDFLTVPASCLLSSHLSVLFYWNVSISSLKWPSLLGDRQCIYNLPYSSVSISKIRFCRNCTWAFKQINTFYYIVDMVYIVFIIVAFSLMTDLLICSHGYVKITLKYLCVL